MLYHINKNIPIKHNPHTSVTVSITKFITFFSIIVLFLAVKHPVILNYAAKVLHQTLKTWE